MLSITSDSLKSDSHINSPSTENNTSVSPFEFIETNPGIESIIEIQASSINVADKNNVSSDSI